MDEFENPDNNYEGGPEEAIPTYAESQVFEPDRFKIRFNSKDDFASKISYNSVAQSDAPFDNCVCDPCECDEPQTPVTDLTDCVCDPCECDPSCNSSDVNQQRCEVVNENNVATLSCPDYTNLLFKPGPELLECGCEPGSCECDPPVTECICNPCECEDPEPPNVKCICDPCECDTPPEGDCTCDICECDPPDLDECQCDPCECEGLLGEGIYDLFSPRGDGWKSFFDKLQENLTYAQKEYCNEVKPKKTKRRELTVHLVTKLAIREKSGKVHIYLPGNQIYPTLLKKRIGDGDIPNITNALLQMSTTHLNLAYNNITDEGMIMLARAIQECVSLESVNLMNNDFTTVGVVALANGLLYRPPLKSLRLSGIKFGTEGFDAFAMVIMAGRAPLDLDISESDLDTLGFQTICCAMHAIDHGIDFPPFLVNRKLPIDLKILRDMKIEFNEAMRLLEFVDKDLSMTDFAGLELDQEQKKVDLEPSEDNDELERCVPQVHNFSASVLEGLFDIRHRLSQEIIPQTILQEEYLGEDFDVGGVMTEAKAMGDVMDVITEFHAEKVVDEDDNVRRIPIVNPSLYELDFVHAVEFADDFEDLAKTERDTIVGLSGKKAKSVKALQFSEAIMLKNEDAPVPDDAMAQDAAKEVAEFVASGGAAIAAQTEIPSSTDVAQLILMSIGEVIKLQQERQAQGINFTEEESLKLLESAMDRVHRLLQPCVPTNCELSDEDLRLFIETFFKTSHKTFLQLFENPYFSMALIQEGTIACREREKRAIEEMIRPHVHPTTDEEIRYIAMQFLDGAIKEAARLVGSGDPFGVRQMNSRLARKETTEFEHAVKTLLITEEVFKKEDELEDVVQNLIEASGRMAAASQSAAKKIHKTDKEFQKIADIFVDDLFETVARTVVDYNDKKEKKYYEELEEEEQAADRPNLGQYPFIGRFARLVLNRPIFNNSEELMGTKLGDFLRDNKSIKALHIQKWNLGEDGMVGLMGGLMLNTTLVLLDLSNNQLAADGVKQLGIYLGVNMNLRHLLLNHNRLKDPGILELVENIAESGLTSLNIAHNNLTWVGLDPLLTAIWDSKIIALYLWGNAYGMVTWKLLKGLFKCDKVQHCDLCLQTVDGSGCVVKNSQLRTVNYWYEVPPIVEEGCQVPPYYLDPVHLNEPAY